MAMWRKNRARHLGTRGLQCIHMYYTTDGGADGGGKQTFWKYCCSPLTTPPGEQREGTLQARRGSKDFLDPRNPHLTPPLSVSPSHSIRLVSRLKCLFLFCWLRLVFNSSLHRTTTTGYIARTSDAGPTNVLLQQQCTCSQAPENRIMDTEAERVLPIGQ